MTCPKGVPRIHPKNQDAHGIFSLLLTHSVQPITGLLKFDASLIGTFSNLFGVGDSEQLELLGKLLFLIETVNASRLKKLDAARKKAEQTARLKEMQGRRHPMKR